MRLVFLTNDLLEICFNWFNCRTAASAFSRTGRRRPHLDLFKNVKTHRISRNLRAILIVLAISIGAMTHAQDITNKNEAIDLVTTGLQVGDTISSLELTSLHNHSSNRLELPIPGVDLTIVDFWATWCGACIAHFPTMITIQDSLKDRVQFVSVSKEPGEEVQRFLSKWIESDKEAINFPIVSGDTVVNSVFPHKTIPHYVWIDRDGAIIAITDSEAVTVESVEKVLAGDVTDIRTRRDVYRDYDSSQPLLYNGPIDTTLISYSELTGYQEGIIGGYHFSQYFSNDHPDFARLTVRNLTIIELFQLAHSDVVLNSQEFFQVNVSDKDRLKPSLSGEKFLDWLRDGNGFCYEIILPMSQKESLIPVMRRDVNGHFSQYSATVEDVLTEFWVLKSVDKEIIRSKGGEKLIENDFEHFRLRNAPLSPLVSRLGHINRQKLRMIDETEIDFNVDLDIKADMRNIEEINQALEPYGLYFELTTRPTPTLVISDNPNAE